MAVTNAANITFPKCTGGSESATHVSIGTDSSGAGVLLWHDALTSALAVSNNITPIIEAGELDVTLSGDISTAMIAALEALLFDNTAFAKIGDASGLQPSAADGSFYVGLHTDSPGAGGDQTTNECAYTSYARVAVARTAGGWTIT